MLGWTYFEATLEATFLVTCLVSLDFLLTALHISLKLYDFISPFEKLVRLKYAFPENVLLMYIIGREEMKLVVFGWNTIEILNWNTDQVNLLKYLCCRLFFIVMDEMIFVVPTDTAVRIGLGCFRYGRFVEEAVGYVEKEVMGWFPGAAGSQRLGNMRIFGGYRNIAEQ